jgi:hypothetical protein
MDETMVILGSGIVLTVAIAQYRLSMRLRRQEELLARLTARLGLDPALPVEPSETVKQLARSPSSYIAAIKTYREQSGVGLVEAKAVVDRLKMDSLSQ